MEKKKQDANVTLLQGVYQAVSMGSDSVLTILGKTQSEQLRTELAAELAGYQKFENIARIKLGAYGAVAEEKGFFEKLPSELSIRMSTLTDDSTSKLAELVMTGSTMGIVELQKQIKAGEKAGAHPDNLELAGGVLTFQQRNIDNMKTFL